MKNCFVGTGLNFLDLFICDCSFSMMEGRETTGGLKTADKKNTQDEGSKLQGPKPFGGNSKSNLMR